MIPTTNSDFNNEIFKKFLKFVDDPEYLELNGLTLFKHQEFLYNYMKEHNNTPQNKLNSRGLLVFHKLGSGKSITALTSTEVCRGYSINNNNFKRKVVMLLPANLLYDPWIKELRNFCFDEKCKIRTDLNNLFNKSKNKVQTKDIRNVLKNNDYHIIHYNANTDNGGWLDQLNNIPTRKSAPNKYNLNDNISINPFDDSVIIIDEVHNLLNSFANEISSGKNNKLKIYKLIMMAKNVKLLFLSATPLVNKPNELSFLFNMLRGNILGNPTLGFSIIQEEFENLFFKDLTTNEIQIKNPKLFQRRINGLVSYFKGADESLFAKKTKDNVMLLMNQLQHQGYMNAYIYDEEQRKLNNLDFNTENATFFLNSIKNSNVVFPDYIFDKNSQKRLKLTKNNKPIEVQVVKLINNIDYIVEPNKENEKKILNILDNDSKPLFVNNELKHMSIKMWQIMNKINECNGPLIVYSRFEGIYGIKLMSLILSQNGFSAYKDNNKMTKGKRFMIWTGKSRNNDFKKIFNSDENKHGDIIKIFLMTASGKEGISLRGIRQIHILDPWWNNVVNGQVAGRGIRMNSHKHIDNSDFLDFQMNISKRINNVPVVNVFEYYAFPRFKSNSKDKVVLLREQQKMKETSIDYYIFNKAQKKATKSKLLLDLMISNSIDCKLFNNNCFIDNYDLNYINYWNVEDNLYNITDIYSEYKKLIYNNNEYWLDSKNNVYIKNDQNFGMINNKKKYKKVGVYKGGIINFNHNHISTTKQNTIVLEVNIFNKYFGKKVNFKKYDIIDISNGLKSIYLSKIFNNVNTIIPHDIILTNDKMIALKNTSNIKIFDNINPAKLKTHFLYIDYNVLSNTSKINNLIYRYPNIIIENFNMNDKDSLIKEFDILENYIILTKYTELMTILKKIFNKSFSNVANKFTGVGIQNINDITIDLDLDIPSLTDIEYTKIMKEFDLK